MARWPARNVICRVADAQMCTEQDMAYEPSGSPHGNSPAGDCYTRNDVSSVTSEILYRLRSSLLMAFASTVIFGFRSCWVSFSKFCCLCSPKFIQIMYRIQFFPHREHFVSITATKQLLLGKHTNTHPVWRKMRSFVNVTGDGTHSLFPLGFGGEFLML